MRQIIVIGAGASGLTAAIAAAEHGASVTVLEAMDRPARKLLLTGSGRCNLTNLRQDAGCYRGAGEDFTSAVLGQFSVADTLAFFRGLGLLTYDRDGYVYPVTGQAASVLDVLLMELQRRKIKLKCREKVTMIQKAGQRFFVQTDSWRYEADAVILCAGSMAAPQTGSDGSGYALAEKCGHALVPPLEALVPLKVSEPFVRQLSGLRMQAAITLQCGAKDADPAKKRMYTERGELQWTDYGISGIAVFQLSRYAARALADGEDVCAVLDLMPFLTEEELASHLLGQSQRAEARGVLAGILPAKAIPVLLSLADIPPDALTLLPEQTDRLAAQIKHMRLNVCGTKSFSQAQACQGGVNCDQVCAQTLESKLVPGLYFAGEVLDVDGICGGYNLQWAWSSGYTAGSHAAIDATGF